MNYQEATALKAASYARPDLERRDSNSVRMPALLDAFSSEREFDESEFAQPDDRKHLTIEAYRASFRAKDTDPWRNVDIKRHHWRPPLGQSHIFDAEFRSFVLSPIPRFDQLMPYVPFFLYLEQARRWNEETKDVEVTDLDADEAQVFTQREYVRMTENSWYALLRYVRIREDTGAEGRKYGDTAGAPQAYLCFLIDRGNSFILLKGRQAAITTTVMAVLSVMMLMRNNWTGVLLTDDKTKTGEDLFDKKVLSTLKLMPEWISQDYTWDRQSKDNATIDFRDDNTKASRRQNFSDLMLLSSDDSQAVNSKSPTITAYDEAQNIANFGKLIGEVSSTQDANIGGVLMLIRQQLAWGTGTSNPVGKGVFLSQWRSTYKAFEAGEATEGWVPLFFDWTCRPGADLDWYLRRRAVAINKYRYENDRSALAIFASACPSHPDDAFMQNDKSVIPTAVIKKHRDRLLGMQDTDRPILGIFKPIYSNDPKKATKQDGYADHPAYIEGVEFIEAKTSYEMLKAPVKLYLKPHNNWLDRNFQGTDPIQAATGRSMFASVIWDSVGFFFDGRKGECCGVTYPHFHPAMACVLNGRTHDPKEMFTQSILMGMYYRNHGQRACKELVEWNQGQHYIEYKQFDWIDQTRSLVGRMELPPGYLSRRLNDSSGAAHINQYGFVTDARTKGRMLTDLEDLVYNHGHNIRFLDFWQQLAECELEEKDGKKTWGTKDSDQFNDDIVVASVLAKICRDCFADRKPRMFDSREAPATKVRRVPVKVPTPMGFRVQYVDQVYTPKYRQ